jgi:penicillin-binding protein 1A
MRRGFLVTFMVLVATCLLGVLGVVGWIVAVAESAPNIDSLKPQDEGANSVVYAADGSRLGFIQSDVLRAPVAGSKMPQVLKDATVAIEDRRFYKHKGVDYVGILRAAVRNLTNDGKAVQGGSTLTMQLVRNLYIPKERNEKTITRKIKEAKLAEQFERKHTKAQILGDYLNDVPYGTVGGQTAVGAQAAARLFFDKPVQQLSLPQAALLAGLPQAPSQYNPFLDKVAALRRRAEVLRAMVKAGTLSPARAARAADAPLGVKLNRYFTARREQFFFDYVRDELNRRYGVNTVRQGGFRIYTTIDLKLQREARQAIANQLGYPGDPASAIVSIDPRNGYIRAMASSATYGKTRFNYATQAHRQPGSTFKVMVLMTALRRGVDPESTYYTSRPLEAGWLKGYPGYRVETYSHSYGGSMNLVQATLKSDNTIYAQLDADMGPDAVRQTAYDMGITSKLDAYPAEGLGGLKNGVSPLEMADAYATVASGGYRNKPVAITRVVHPSGEVDDLGKPHRVKVFDSSVTGAATKILHQNIQSGTGTAADYGCPAAGKTGTTSDYKDAWFVGFEPHLATAVWVGYANPPIPMTSVHGIEVAGGTFPAQIWHDFMTVAHGSFCQDFPPAPPFQSNPFFGRYASTGSRRSGSGGSGSGGGGKYYGGGGTGTAPPSQYNNPNLYQAPPQVAPPPPPVGGGGGQTSPGGGNKPGGGGQKPGGGHGGGKPGGGP